MKRIFLLLTIFSISILGFSQTLKLDVVKDGLKVGRTSPKVVVANQIATLQGIDTTKTIKEQLDEKLNAADIVDPIATGLIYSAGAVDAFQSQNTKILADFKALGFVGKLLPACLIPINVGGGNEALVSGRHRISTIVVEKTTTYTEFKFILTIAGVYTPNNVNGIALYSYSAGTSTLIASSVTTNANMWTTLGLNTVTIAAPQTLTPGVYRIAFLYSTSAQTTAPTILTLGSLQTNTYMFSNSNMFQGRTEGKTSFPATEGNGGLSVMSTIPAIWLN